MKRGRLLLICLGAGAAALSYASWRGTGTGIETYAEVARLPRLRPDYTGTTIPPNIAPLNFVVDEPGTRYRVRIHSAQGEPVEISGKTPEIRIPPGSWRALLRANRGKPLFVDVCVKGADKAWKRFARVTNRVAEESIDGYVMYRLMKPIYTWWRDIRICQRNLENCDESLVISGESFGACLNCHSFLNNDPRRMFLGIRSRTYGSSVLQVSDGAVSKIGTKFGYTAWHPSGRLAVFSVFNVKQFFHASRPEIRDFVELDSAMAYYDLEKKNVGVAPPLSAKDQLEAQPTWTPDGRYLYFCSAPKPWADADSFTPEQCFQLKYDLKRAPYDLETNTWGEVETALSAQETGLSVLLPRISPDGRFLLFCMCGYSCFPLNQPDSDLYLLDLATGKYEKLDAVNSDAADSWHSWSTNSRWIVFSSKRTTPLFTKLYFSYIDETGKAHKPFVLPQKDPKFYDTFAKLYNVPELIAGPVKVSRRALGRAVLSSERIEVDSVTGATPKAPAAEPASQRHE